MSAHDYSGLDLGFGRLWGRAGWSLFSVGLIVALVGAGIILAYVLVVLMYSLSLAE